MRMENIWNTQKISIIVEGVEYNNVIWGVEGACTAKHVEQPHAKGTCNVPQGSGIINGY